MINPNIEIAQFLNQLWKRRWTAILVSWFLCVIGWGMVALLPDIYQSHARIYVDTTNLLRPLLKDITVESNIGDEILRLRQTLLSTPNIQKVLRKTDLDLAAKTSEDMQDLIDQLRSDTVLTSTRTNLFSISFNYHDAKRARDVVQAYISIFIESNLGENRSDMDEALKFLKVQVKAYRRKLEAAEMRLAKFTQKHGNLKAQASGTRYRDYEKAIEALRDAEAKRVALKEQLSEIKPFIEQSIGTGQSGAGPPSGGELLIVELETYIEKLLGRYTEQHPEVLSARRRLEATREKQDRERASLANPGTNSGVDESGRLANAYRESNPIYQAVKLEIIRSETNIRVMKERLARAQNVWQEIQRKRNLTPYLATEFAKLKRDQMKIMKTYMELSSGLETAQMTNEQNIKASKIQFRMIDQPEIAAKPVGPPRLLYLTLVLIFGLAGGIGISALSIMVDDTISDLRTLKSSFAIPVFGFVRDLRMGQTSGLKFLDRSGVILVGSSLVAVFVVLVVIEYQIGLGKLVTSESAWAIKDMLIDGVAKLASGIL